MRTYSRYPIDIYMYISIFVCPIYVTHVWRLTILLSKTCMAAGDAAAAAAASATADWRYILERLYNEQELQKLANCSCLNFFFELHSLSQRCYLYKFEILSKLNSKLF